MAYFRALVIVPPEEKNIKQAVHRLIAPYSRWIEVPPWKYYLRDSDISSLAHHHGIPSGNLEQLATKIKNGGLDENGLYYLTTRNPKGMWDSWSIDSDWDGLVQKRRKYGKAYGWNIELEQLNPPYNTCLVSQVPKFHEFPEVITPDGVWHSWDIKPAFSKFDVTWDDWYDKILTLMEQYADHIAVYISCHF